MRLSTSTNDEILEKLRTLVQSDRGLTIRELTEQVEMSIGCCDSLLTQIGESQDLVLYCDNISKAYSSAIFYHNGATTSKNPLCFQFFPQIKKIFTKFWKLWKRKLPKRFQKWQDRRENYVNAGASFDRIKPRICKFSISLLIRLDRILFEETSYFKIGSLNG